MKKRVLVSCLIAILGIYASAQDYSALYEARLSSRDHVSSNGTRLTDVVSILRQDRANFHKFGKRDAEDQSDDFFSNAQNRELMDRYFKAFYSQTPLSSKDKNAILKGTPKVKVSLVNGIGREKFLSLEVLSNEGSGSFESTEAKEPGTPVRTASQKGGTMSEMASKLLGTWSSESGHHLVTYVFKSDGTYSSTSTRSYGQKEIKNSGKGKWSLVGKKLMLNGQDSGTVESLNTRSFRLHDDLMGGTFTRSR